MPFEGWEVKERVRDPDTGKSKWGTVRYTPEEAIEIAVQDGHWRNIPPALLRIMTRNMEERPWDSLSPSGLTDCIRCKYLRSITPYWLDPADQMSKMRGNAWHFYLDEREPGVSEVKLMTVLSLEGPDGEPIAVPFTGTRDYREPGVARIIDYKSTGTVSQKVDGKWVDKDLPTPEHELQVNMYAYLDRVNGTTVNCAQVSYITNNGTIRSVPCELWTFEDQEETAYNFAAVMAEAILAVKRGELPPKYEEYSCRWMPPSIQKLCEEAGDAGTS